MSPTKSRIDGWKESNVLCHNDEGKDRSEDLVPALRNHVLPWAVRRSAARLAQ